MNFHVLQSIGIILYLIADIELILCLKPGKHIVFCRDGTEPLLVPGNYIQGYKPFHSLLIAILKIDIPIPSQPFIVPVYLAFICVEVYLINAQIIHAEGVKDIKTPLLQFTDQVPPFQGGHNKICRHQHRTGQPDHRHNFAGGYSSRCRCASGYSHSRCSWNRCPARRQILAHHRQMLCGSKQAEGQGDGEGQEQPQRRHFPQGQKRPFGQAVEG